MILCFPLIYGFLIFYLFSPLGATTTAAAEELSDRVQPLSHHAQGLNIAFGFPSLRLYLGFVLASRPKEEHLFEFALIFFKRTSNFGRARATAVAEEFSERVQPHPIAPRD